MKIADQLTKLNHHAYCIAGNDLAAEEIVNALAKLHGIEAKSNPDFAVETYETFTISDARRLKDSSNIKPVDSSGKKIFILTLDSITTEAQNALLKLLEEPAEYAHFFLIVPSAYLLLPTVKSRLFFLEWERGNLNAVSKKEAEAFLKLGLSKKLEFIKKLTDDISKERKTKRAAVDFLNAVEAVVYKEKGVKTGRKTLESIQLARKYLNDRAPSVKMLLELVTLSL
ncbi:hypothetical protein KGQ27_01535 [Patescibacteria group bacterium]|nr:hypothetical protein [Patescibacteria group bacterium]MDE1946476.1 hypothetical protein [Patescibacteria group bacterium]MDE2011172.1 hypothetical protein [Patescibacteria group bacterium]MDE2233554.1 hypothetical protein [Patescibacteria group bacterium]